MCGIIGAFNRKGVRHTLLSGLKKLEYRGYDSSGIAILGSESIQTRKTLGKLNALETSLSEAPIDGFIGIGHTRWATHGQPSVENAHPHVCGPVAVVHNGIFENHSALRAELRQMGHKFHSDTDSEVVPHLIHHYIRQGMSNEDAIRTSLHRVRGSFALGILIDGPSPTLYAARRESPLAVGESDLGFQIASDATAMESDVKHVTYLENDDIAVIKEEGLQILNKKGFCVKRMKQALEASDTCHDKNGYDHFMQKEIKEQLLTIPHTLADSEIPDQLAKQLTKINKIVMIACGTSHYACSLAKYWIEKLAQVSVEIDIASEFRYRHSVLDKQTLAIFLSQSGETADTYAALKKVADTEAKILSVVNVEGSSIARESDYVMKTQAGAEIGVASTKAFTSQLMLLLNFARQFSAIKFQNTSELSSLMDHMANLPEAIESVFQNESCIKSAARKIRFAKNALFVGRGLSYPVALEGALKLKEISYIHAEGYAAGELKHGPIALVDYHTPIVAIIADDELYEKSMSNLREILARQGRVTLVGCQKAIEEIGDEVETFIPLPETHPDLTPFPATVILQLLAYHVAVDLDKNVDQPRNLAKSVTVE